MLSWEGLLCAQRYFPDIPDFLHQPSGKDLFDFLSKFAADRPEMEHKGGDEKNGEGSKQKGSGSKPKKGNDSKAKRGKGSKAKEGDCSKDTKGTLETGTVSFETVIELVKELQKSEVVHMDLVDSVVDQMKHLKHCLSPEDDKHVKNTCQKISDLKVDNLTPQRRLTLTSEILEMITVLKKHSLLYHKLRPNSALRCGEIFAGMRHCEACIASLNYLSGLARSRHDPQVEVLLSEFMVSLFFMLCLILY